MESSSTIFSPPPKHSFKDAGVLVLFLLFWSAITLLFDGVIGWGIYRQIEAMYFDTARGLVTRSELASHPGSHGTTYSADVRFEYEVDGERYVSDTWRFGGWSSSDRGNARRILRQFPFGAEVEVHYDRANPGRAVLVPGVQGADLFLILFILPFNAVMIGGWLGVASDILGLNTIHPRRTIDGQAIRFGRVSGAALIALVLPGATAFAALFPIAFIFGWDPPLALMRIVLPGILALGPLGFIVTLAWNLRRPDLLINERRRQLILPVVGHADPIDFDRILDIKAEKHRPTGSERVCIHYRDPAGSRCTIRLPHLGSRRDTHRVAQWLRQNIGLPDHERPPP